MDLQLVCPIFSKVPELAPSSTIRHDSAWDRHGMSSSIDLEGSEADLMLPKNVDFRVYFHKGSQHSLLAKRINTPFIPQWCEARQTTSDLDLPNLLRHACTDVTYIACSSIRPIVRGCAIDVRR